MLTEREAEVVELAACGLSNKAIAATLACSIRTVEWHIENAATKIPGSGKPRFKCVVWFFLMAAPEEVETG